MKSSRLSMFVVAIAFLSRFETHAQISSKAARFDSSRVDTNYFLSKWKLYTYYLEKKKRRYIRPGWSPYVSCCERMKDSCDKRAEIVAISREWEDSGLPDILAFHWVCETGHINLKLKLPDTLFTDERHQVSREIPYKWKARKINYISKDEFVIMDWPTYENKPTYHHFVRLKKDVVK